MSSSEDEGDALLQPSVTSEDLSTVTWRNDISEKKIELAEEKAQSAADELETQKKVTKKSIRDNYGKANRSLLEDLETMWMGISVPMFVQNLEMLSGASAKAYLKYLCIQINPEAFNLTELKNATRQIPREPVIVSITADGTDEWVDTATINKRNTSEMTLFAKWWDNFKTFNVAKTEMEFSWTKALKLLTADPQQQVYVIKALADTGLTSGVFNTPVGHGIMHMAWKTVQRHYWFERFCDLQFLLVLWTMGHFIRHQESAPTSVLLFGAVLAIRSFGMPLLELFFACRLYGWQVTKFFTLFNLVFFLIELVSAILLLVIIFADFNTKGLFHHTTPCLRTILCASGDTSCTAEKGCFLANHPMFFCFVVGVKWFYFSLSCLCSRFLGENVLPAFHAVTSKEAIAYMAFLGLCFQTAFQAYFVLPIDENWESAKERNWALFDWVSGLKIYRLLFLGDFDVFELQGVASTLTAQINGTHIFNGVVDDQDIPPMTGKGVNVGFVILTISISLMFMNVGIGLLGNLYNDAKARKHQIHQHFKADYCVRLLLWRVHCPDWCISCGTEILDAESVLKSPGVWLACDRTELKDDADETLSICQELQDDMEEVKLRLKRVGQ